MLMFRLGYVDLHPLMKSMQVCCVVSEPEYACKILRTLCASFQNCNESPKPVVDARGSLRPNGEDPELTNLVPESTKLSM